MRHIAITILVILAGCSDSNPLYPAGGDTPYQIRGEVAADELRVAIAAQVPGRLWNVHTGDPEYRKYGIDEVMEFIVADDTDEIEYRVNDFDCEDHALVLAGRMKEAMPGIPVGFMWCVYYDAFGVYPHAFNVFYDGYTGKLYIFDAASDRFVTPRIIVVFLVVM